MNTKNYFTPFRNFNERDFFTIILPFFFKKGLLIKILPGRISNGVYQNYSILSKKIKTDNRQLTTYNLLSISLMFYLFSISCF